MACIICNKDINSGNDTKEHIIPNSIGGRRKIRRFICKNCNNTTGHSWDDKLADQLKPLCTLYSITRDRGSPTSLTMKTELDEQVIYNPDGSIGQDRVHEKVNGVNVSLSIPIPMKNSDKKQIKGYERKYPNIDIESAISKAAVRERPSGTLRYPLRFGGECTYKAIVKSTLATIFDAGEDPSNCDIALKFLKNETESMPMGYFYKRNIVKNRCGGIPLHCYYVKGCPVNNHIVAYVEIFGSFRIALLLSSGYEGKKFEHQYAIDPIFGNELNTQIIFDLSSAEISNLSKEIPQLEIKKALESTFMYISSFKTVVEGFQKAGLEENKALATAKEAMLIPNFHKAIEQ